MRRRGLDPWIVAIAVSLSAVVGRTGTAQTTGSIAGRVSDSSGAALLGVTVEASSQSLQGIRSVLTDSQGRYRFPAVPPGIYRIQARREGFRTVEKTTSVSLDATATADLTLTLAAEEQVLVAGETSPIDTTSTTTGTAYEAALIARLPVDRNYADIARANPGVVVDRGATQESALQLSIYGATSAENLWIIDDVNTTNVSLGIQGTAIHSEFVQEVQVKTGGYSAEYGGALGGIVNAVTKSGGNHLHGDGFLYYDTFDWAGERERTAEDAALYDMQQVGWKNADFGADLGGPVWRDRLWFFLAYDRVAASSEASRVDATQYVSTEDIFPLDGSANLYSVKLTWNASAGTSLVGTAFSNASSTQGAQGLVTSTERSTWDAHRAFGGTDYGLRLSEIAGSRVLLGLSVARHQDRYELTASSGSRVRDFTCGGTVDNPCNRPPQENTATGGFGYIEGPADHTSSRRNQVRAESSLFLANHDLKLGGGYQAGDTLAVWGGSGTQIVDILNDSGFTYYEHHFLVGPDGETPVLSVTSRPKKTDYGAYVQDSWRPSARWTVNAGLRWDAEEVRDYRDIAVIKIRNEWQPRIGVAWDPGGDGSTKVYAFAGRFYYALPTEIALLVYGNLAAVHTYNFDPVSTAQDDSTGHGIEHLGGPYGDPVDAGLRGIFHDEYTVGIDRAFGPTLTVGLKATYRELGNAIEDRCGLNSDSEVTYNSTCGIVNPGSNGKIARGDVPGCNGLWDTDLYQCTDTIPATPRARRVYRGIELLARKTLSQGLWLQASYVYSSLKGNYDGAVNEEYGFTTPGTTPDFDYPQISHNAEGRLYLDRPHRFRLDGYYVTPFRLLVGLQFWALSGAPLNTLGYFAPRGSVIQLVPRGSAGRLPTEWEANLTLQYPIAIGPATVTLLAYVFDLFNNQIPIARDNVWTDGPPDGYPSNLYDPNQEPHNTEYGKITARQDPRSLRLALRVSF